MPDQATFLLFLGASLVLLVTPGPAVLYIVARSVHQGHAAGLASTLGVAIGTVFHVGAAALGLSALLVSSTLAFNGIKYLGAAYLIYLGIRKLHEPDQIATPEAMPPRSLRHIFYQGVLVNLLNPKTALFFFAFLPQFVDLPASNVAGQILLLGLIFIGLGILSDGAWALLAGSVGQWLRGNLRALRWQRHFAGVIYIALGVTMALAGAESKK